MEQEIDAGTPASAEEEQQNDTAQQQREAAFAAMVEGKATEAPPEPEDQTEAQAETPPEPKYAQITEDEYQDLKRRLSEIDALKASAESLNKGVNTLSGRVGGLQQGINNRQVIKLPKEKLERLRSEMPEIVDLFDALEVTTAAPAVDDARIGQLAQERLAPEINRARDEALTTARRELREELLSQQHADWREYTGTPEFSDFAKAQGAEFQAKLAQASKDWDHRFIGKAITDAKAAKAKATSAASARRVRMESNVNPRGSAAQAAPVLSREEAFQAHIAEVSRRR